MPTARPLPVLRLVSPARLRRLVTSALLTLSLTVGALASTATPADAASYVMGCFRSDKAGMGIAGVTVQLQVYYLGAWFTIATTSLSPSQCAGWNINPDTRPYYLRMLVNYQASGARWVGSSPLMALPGDGAAHLGTGVVTCYGCAY